MHRRSAGLLAANGISIYLYTQFPVKFNFTALLTNPLPYYTVFFAVTLTFDL